MSEMGQVMIISIATGMLGIVIIYLLDKYWK